MENITKLSIVIPNATVEFNDDINGFVIKFDNGAVAQTQLYTEENRLHADFGKQFLERYREYDSELTEQQDSAVDDFISSFNKEAAEDFK